ncbi:MAG: phosphoribosylaminoimidazolesuccinocarboxamide synthase [Oligoflexia bacterium]|nr:phosphoribosylaminoimidazolesuccinocarboxamide synthase [Oligoflexia bacterium]
MTVEKRDLLYEGKAKKIFSTTTPSTLIQEFKDSLTAFNAQKKGSFQGKGEVNLKITTCIFKHLASYGIPTHFISNIDAKNMVVEKLTMIPLEVVVRNRAAGSFSTRLGVPEGTRLDGPFVEFYYKKDELADPIVTEDHILALKLSTLPEIKILRDRALEINIHLLNMFSEIGIELIDFKLEFGRNNEGRILLADEISPDSCRLWDLKTQEKLDKDRFRRDLGKVEESYNLVCDKLLKKWSH